MRIKPSESEFSESRANALEAFMRCLETGDVAAAPKCVLVAAHPDDETLGAGAQLAGPLRRITIVHVTDGAPRKASEAIAHGFETPEAYARQRRQELAKAMEVAGIGADQLVELGIRDQESFLALNEISRRLAGIFVESGAEIVITHPYEGGHPDHDSAAFCVHAAHDLIQAKGDRAPVIVEFPSYHLKDEKLLTGHFLSDSVPLRANPLREINIHLSGPAKLRKLRILRSFASQLEVIRMFDVEWERFREAPAYDFSAAPHPGGLLYEAHDWGTSGVLWREKAVAGLRELAIRKERL